METMKAIVKEKLEPGVTIKEVPMIKEIGPKEVLVEIKASAICGTDIHIYDWNEWSQHNITPPRVIGHEFSGIVVETGKEVKSIKVGDHVSAETHIACGHCYMCKTGAKHICQNLKILGVHVDGAFTKYIKIPEENAWLNSKDLPFELGAIQEPLGNAVYTVLSGDIVGKNVLITGAGPIGLMAINVAKAAGAAKVIVSEPGKFRSDFAYKMGADIVVNPLEQDLIEIVMESTSGLGADVGLEMSGNHVAINQLLKAMKKTGRVSLLGLYNNDVTLNLNDDVIFKNLEIKGIVGRLMFETWYQIKAFLDNNKLDVDKLITHKLGLSQFEKGIELLKKGEAIKVVMNYDFD